MDEHANDGYLRRSAISAFEPDRGGRRLRSFGFDGFRVSAVAFAENVELSTHYHEHTCLTLVLEGGFAETMSSRTLEAGAHSVIVKPRGAVHHDEIYRDGVRSIIVSLDPDDERFVEFEQQLSTPLLQRHDALASIALEMDREITHPDPMSPLALESLVMSLAASVGRAVSQQAPSRGPSWLDAVLDFVHASPPRRITLADVASVAGVHQTQVSRVFRQQYGVSLGSYIRRVRLEHVAELLVSSSRSVCEIALQCGFSDQSHLTNAFRRQYGITPGRFRRLRG